MPCAGGGTDARQGRSRGRASRRLYALRIRPYAPQKPEVGRAIGLVAGTARPAAQLPGTNALFMYVATGSLMSTRGAT